MSNISTCNYWFGMPGVDMVAPKGFEIVASEREFLALRRTSDGVLFYGWVYEDTKTLGVMGKFPTKV